MWFLTLRSPSTDPIDYPLKPGINTLGRRLDNDIVISDESASRRHAEIVYQANMLVISDLNSTNGTYVNRGKISGPTILHPDDQIQIGEHVAIVNLREEKGAATPIEPLSGTQPLTHDLLQEAVDQNSVMLFKVANQLTRILDLKTSLEEIAKVMRISMGADRGEVILVNQFERLAELGFPTTIAQEAIAQHSVVMIPDLAALTGQKFGKSASLLHIRSIICAPVIIDTQVAALIYAYKVDPASRPFDQNDVQIAAAISSQTALTLQRSALLEKKVNFDSLTGLYHRSVFIELAETELQRAIRFKHCATIIMLDIDEFKRVNDTCGHLVGDQILQGVALRCKRQIRESDLLGRFGGDEYILMLVETGAVEGKLVAERIRSQIAEAPFVTECGPVSVTVSQGVATLNDDCQTLTSLIQCADEALYKAKNASKNQVQSN